MTMDQPRTIKYATLFGHLLRAEPTADADVCTVSRRVAGEWVPSPSPLVAWDTFEFHFLPVTEAEAAAHVDPTGDGFKVYAIDEAR